ncbi:Very long-chain fatty acid transport protein [Teratosphaeria destructans]|uniref:Very long-chain fatty acid transport protein n=1 Tax=Teratosphaeria destructans TaxID=418781 RepID=A0A9W7SYD0_9PEZI|nr:Very long-chain fatty acid transport protein [Teratosphaeria destructans]
MAAALQALAEIPRSVALPALVAAGAYINGKYGVSQDIWAISQALWLQIRMGQLEKKDRVNCFYKLEEWAIDAKTAGRTFLVIPSDESRPGAQTEWTYAEAYETILKYARWLKEAHGVQKEEIVAMDFTNRPIFVWVWFALWSLGAKPAFINSNLRDRAFVHCVRIADARLLLVDESIADEVLTDDTKPELSSDGRGRAIETTILDASTQSTILSGTPYRADDSARSGAMISSPAMLIYTSGTTGLPKAAYVNWGKPLSGCVFFMKVLALTKDDRYFSALPLYHSSGSVLGVVQALGPGCAFVLCPKFSPRTIMKQVSETKATALQYIGEMCRYMVSAPPGPFDKKHSLRLAFGNGMRPDVWQRFKDRFNIPTIVEFYGATEAPGASLVVENSGFYRGAVGRAGVVNRAIFGQNAVLVKHDHETELPIRDPKTNFGVKCARDEIGELVHPLDPDNIKDKFVGYHGNEKASGSKIIRDLFKKGDAYYRTGDLQKLDRDGRWYFIDRIGDTFRWKSENVSTAEVSEALGTHPIIREANVYGVHLPNHDGRAGCAAIGLSEGQALSDAVRRELATHAKKRLPRYAVPLFLRLIREDLETTGTFKHQKVALRNQGVDPGNVGKDEIYWLPPGSEMYEPFGEAEWAQIKGGSAKL